MRVLDCRTAPALMTALIPTLTAGVLAAPAQAAAPEDPTRLTGTVRTSDGAVAAGVGVEAIDSAGGYVATTTDARGRYSVATVDPAYVAANGPAYGWVRRSYRVTPAPGGTVRRDLVLKSDLDVSFTTRGGVRKATLVMRIRPWMSTVRNRGTITVRWKKPNGRAGTLTRTVDGQRKVRIHLPRIKSGKRAVTVRYVSPVTRNAKRKPAVRVR